MGALGYFLTRRVDLVLRLWLLILVGAAHSVIGQVTTLHLHQEASSTSGLNQLRTSGPDTEAVALQSAQLRNSSPGSYIT